MLLKLFIENYALIQKLEIDWHPGFSVITGETGAGKTILLGALSLVLGQRAEASVLFNKEAKCIVEGTFRITSYGLESFFQEQELDYDDMLVLRREISPGGKSRAFINDTPVNLNQMKELGDRLVNIHSQHSIITLNQANFQLEILDDYASIQQEINTFRETFMIQEDRRAQLSGLCAREARFRGETDYHQFLYDELTKAALSEGEQQELEEQLDILTHAEEIKKGLSFATHTLENADPNLLGLLTEVLASLKGIAGFHQEVTDIVARLDSNLIDIKDITKELQRLEDHIQVDPDTSERVSARLDLIYRLQKKHQVSSIKELLGIQEELSAKLLETESLDDRIAHLSREIEEAGKELLTMATSISEARRKAIPSFEKEITALLADLGMPSARFTIECTQSAVCTVDGLDAVKFLFSANKGVPPDEVSRIASGGELSRLMLSVKSMISRKNLLPTIIFDEIDSGVSGDIAGKVGMILQRMATTMQVIVITHLPQIAGKGEGHYWVFKEDANGTTRSNIRRLLHEERIEEIAKMVSSERVTKASYQTAKELLAN
ncbi:MAG: DNA repair protein RecN [Bacteroidetes bacterium]|nr:MAG: DNA repair protein RecN [Bacteroidota bacterium]